MSDTAVVAAVAESASRSARTSIQAHWCASTAHDRMMRNSVTLKCGTTMSDQRSPISDLYIPDWREAWKLWNGELPREVRDQIDALFPSSPWNMGSDHRWYVSHNRYDSEDITELVYDLARDWWEGQGGD